MRPLLLVSLLVLLLASACSRSSSPTPAADPDAPASGYQVVDVERPAQRAVLRPLAARGPDGGSR